MQHKQKKLAEIFKWLWDDRDFSKAEFQQVGEALCALMPDAEIIEVLSEIRAIAWGVREAADPPIITWNIQEDSYDLLVWIKARELGWRAKAADDRNASVFNVENPRNSADYPTEEAKSLQFGIYMGRAEAYYDVWRQILFPGRSVEDGTLDADVLAAAEKEWTEKGEEQRRKAGGG